MTGLKPELTAAGFSSYPYIGHKERSVWSGAVNVLRLDGGQNHLKVAKVKNCSSLQCRMKDEGFLKQGREQKCQMEMRSFHGREGVKQESNGYMW